MRQAERRVEISRAGEEDPNCHYRQTPSQWFRRRGLCRSERSRHMKPTPQRWEQICQHSAVDDSHYRMSDAFTAVNISQRFPDATLDDEIGQCQYDLRRYDCGKDNGPKSLPCQMRKRAEERRVKEITRGAQL